MLSAACQFVRILLNPLLFVFGTAVGDQETNIQTFTCCSFRALQLVYTTALATLTVSKRWKWLLAFRKTVTGCNALSSVNTCLMGVWASVAQHDRLLAYKHSVQPEVGL